MAKSTKRRKSTPPKKIWLVLFAMPFIILGSAAMYSAAVNIYLLNDGVAAEAKVISAVPQSGKSKGGIFTYEYTTPENDLVISDNSVSRSFYEKNMGAKTVKIIHGNRLPYTSIVEEGNEKLLTIVIILMGILFGGPGVYILWYVLKIPGKLNEPLNQLES